MPGRAGLLSTALLCLLPLTLAIGCGAAAQDLPVLGLQSLVQLQADQWINPSAKSGTDFYPKLTQDITLEFTPELALVGLIRFQSLTNPPAGAVRVVQNEALYAEELFGQWSLPVNERPDGNDFISIRLGKLSPNFARAWRVAPGIFGDIFTGDYQVVEQVGGEVSYGRIDPDVGIQAVSVAATHGDNSFLSQSMFTNRGQVHLRDGGPSNTDAPSSLTIAYDGVRFPVLGGSFSYQVAFAELGRGRGDTGQESLLSVGLNAALPVPAAWLPEGNGGELRPLVEAVQRWNTNGVQGATTSYLTLGLEFVTGRWNADMVYTSRRVNGVGARDDAMAQATAGYAFDRQWMVSAGYLYERVAGVVSHAAALQLSYSFNYCVD